MTFSHTLRGTALADLAQTEDEGLQAKARAAAAELGLAYEYRFTGFGGLPAWVAASVSAGMPAKGD